MEGKEKERKGKAGEKGSPGVERKEGMGKGGINLSRGRLRTLATLEFFDQFLQLYPHYSLVIIHMF